jgi:hypothetical protein
LLGAGCGGIVGNSQHIRDDTNRGIAQSISKEGGTNLKSPEFKYIKDEQVKKCKIYKLQ